MRPEEQAQVIADVFAEAGWRTYEPKQFEHPEREKRHPLYSKWYVQARHPGRDPLNEPFDRVNVWLQGDGSFFLGGPDNEHVEFARRVLEAAGLGHNISAE